MYSNLCCLLLLSGVDFLLRDQEVSLTVIHALRGIHDVQNRDLLSLRYASVLLSKGFFVRPRDVGMIVEIHMRAVSSLLSLTSYSSILYGSVQVIKF